MPLLSPLRTPWTLSQLKTTLWLGTCSEMIDRFQPTVFLPPSDQLIRFVGAAWCYDNFCSILSLINPMVGSITYVIVCRVVQQELTQSACARSGVGMNNKVNFRAWWILSTYFLDHHFNFLQRVTKIFAMILNYDQLWLAVMFYQIN